MKRQKTKKSNLTKAVISEIYVWGKWDLKSFFSWLFKNAYPNPFLCKRKSVFKCDTFPQIPFYWISDRLLVRKFHIAI